MEPESAALPRKTPYAYCTYAPPPPAPPSESARALAHYKNASVPAVTLATGKPTQSHSSNDAGTEDPMASRARAPAC
jgi:hypothetical protein